LQNARSRSLASVSGWWLDLFGLSLVMTISHGDYSCLIVGMGLLFISMILCTVEGTKDRILRPSAADSAVSPGKKLYPMISLNNQMLTKFQRNVQFVPIY
jgi:hypothetical protein